MSAESDTVYSPDQLKPGNRKRATKGALISAAVMLLFLWGNHEGNTENIYIVLIAIGLVVAIVGDAVLRRAGLRSNDQ